MLTWDFLKATTRTPRRKEPMMVSCWKEQQQKEVKMQELIEFCLMVVLMLERQEQQSPTTEEQQRQELPSGKGPCRHVAPPRFPSRPLVARTPTSMGSLINISTAAAWSRSREELQELVLTNMVI
jgi:hypothetical protein